MMSPDLSGLSLRKRGYLLATYLVLILIGSSLPGSSIPDFRLFTYDKLLHFLEYAGLGWLLMAFFQERPGLLMPTLLLGMVFAALDEWHQPWFQRTCSLGDWIADSAGLISATALYRINSLRSIRREKKTTEHNSTKE